MSTLPSVELGVLGPLQVRQDAAPVAIPGAKPRAILTMLGLHNGSVVSADTLIELLWGDDPPRTAGKALQTHISSLRRTLGDGVVLTEGAGWTLAGPLVDATHYKSAAKVGREAAVAGDTSQAVARFDEALTLWRGVPELPDGQRGLSEKTRWIEGHAALVEDRADALLATGRAAEVIGDLEAAVAEAPLRERRWGQLMLALYRAGRQGEALGAYQRARSLLADQLGVDPGPELRRLEAAIVAQDSSLDIAVAQHVSSMTRTVTFLLTDIEGSTAAWEADAQAMAAALARHDELVEQVVTSRGGRLIKTRGEGDATFSVFERPSAGAAAAIELQDAIGHEPWALREPLRIRVALHTGEVELRDGDYFGRAVNRAARLRSLAVGGQILCSGATAELVIDSLSDDVVLTDLGMRQLRNLARPEHVFELRLETAEDGPGPQPTDAPVQRPGLPAVLVGAGPFVGRGRELERLLTTFQTALAGAACAALIAGEPGVGKTRLAGEWSRQAYDQGALVIYGRCDEDLGAPYQPFAEALRALVPCVGPDRLRGLRGVEALLALVPGLTDVVPDLAAPTRADPDTERYALFDAVVSLLGVASVSAPIVLILDDLHWAAKPTLLLLRHLLRFGDRARVQIVGTYRSTDLDRSHPLAAMLADLHRDGTADRLNLSGLDEDDVTAYVAKAGYDDEELAHALASVTGGNPFFLIEALRHVDESGGVWDQSTLPQGVREAVSRRLSRLPAETNKALAAAAVVGSRFALDLVERVVGDDLVDAFDEACQAGIVIEEPGGHYRFNHAIVRQSLLAELASVRRMRLHQRIATTLENQPGADDELLAELAYHYFECAWAGNAVKAAEYCRRAADQALTRLAYEGAADLYDHALHALEEIDDELPDRDDQVAELLVARCEALLAAGDVASAAGAVSQLEAATVDSARLAAWATCFNGQLSMLVHPERLDEVEAALGEAAEKLAGLDDAAGEAQAHTVHAACLARLGRIGDCEVALDHALTAARRTREHRRVNAVLAGAPLAALWGPNPVPRAGGRCLDVVRLLRITTDSPAVEATSTRCQAVLEAFRGRASAARRMIDSARRAVTELGLRHALLEVEQFAGIVELVDDDPAAAEPHLRKAYNGFRRMGLDADTAETAALLGRTCLALDRDAEADELCTESEHLAGHALKASIAWRTLRAHLLSRGTDHDEARRVAEAAVSLAERTDALVDHGDACHTLATVLGAAGDAAGARAAAGRAAGLYERKGAAALAERARHVVGRRVSPATASAPVAPSVELDNACVRAIRRGKTAIDREAWNEYEGLWAPDAVAGSRRKMVGFTQNDLRHGWLREARRLLETREVRLNSVDVIAVRGERLALTRLALGSADASPGAPRDEFLQLFGIDEAGRLALQVSFDLEDIEAAIAELDATHERLEGQPRAPRLENAASRVVERNQALFDARDWAAMTEMLADDISTDDRRRVVGAGVRRGRNVAVEDARANAELGAKLVASTVVATRGEHLVLCRTHYSTSAEPAEKFHVDALLVYEINADERIAAALTFDPDDFDAAIAELDARYLAGEAAPHAHAWSVVAGAYAAFNRRESSTTTPDWVNIDHRRGAGFAPGDMIAYLRAAWEDSPDTKIYIATVHRLSNIGAVVTHAARGVSQGGFDAEWRDNHLLTIDGDLVNRCELFDEADLDTALARFDELSRPTPRLENAASRLYERFQAHLSTRDWDALAETVGNNSYTEDRRRVVNSGIRYDRDAVDDLRALADVGFRLTLVGVIAIRGERLALTHVRGSGQDPGAIESEALNVVESDADERFSTVVVFDLDDFDAAIAELDARYLAGEAAAHAHVWSVVTQTYAGLNRGEWPATAHDWQIVDHRQVITIPPNDMLENFRASWDLVPNLSLYIEAVHRLSDIGAVFTQAVKGTSEEGFEAEWRINNTTMFEGENINRVEMFDESDIDTAIARFEQLSQPAPRLENAASQAVERYVAHFVARDWDALAEVLADDIVIDDRRRIVNAGTRHGRETEIANLRATADAGFTYMTSVVIAGRGERLILARAAGRDDGSEEFLSEALAVVEVSSHNQIRAIVVFDIDDFEAAIAELDTRYLAGEAAAHARSWSVITEGYASLNRRELPATTTDFANIDHRRGRAFAPGDLRPYLRASWDVSPRFRIYIEAVHRLSDLGAVVTHTAYGTSSEGFEAEWREVNLLTADGDAVNQCELFDEADIDAALAKFEQLHPQMRAPENAASRTIDRFLAFAVLARFEELHRRAHRVENPASQAAQRFFASLGARNWVAMADILVDNSFSDDRRRVVNAGVWHGRDVLIAKLRETTDPGVEVEISAVSAIRGRRLALSQVRWSISEHGPEAFRSEALCITEMESDELIAAIIMFDPDDMDTALKELDARYLAGEAAPYAQTWSVIAEAHAGFNRHELPATTSDPVYIDHQPLVSVEEVDLAATLRAVWDLTPQASVYIEAVHRLSEAGAVITQALKGTSKEGFDAEWWMIDVFIVQGDLISRVEVFDEADIDAAITRFEELQPRPRRLENAATRAGDRFFTLFRARDWEAIAKALTEDSSVDDRRRVVNAGRWDRRNSVITNMQALAEGWTNLTMTVVATRGERLALTRICSSNRDLRYGNFDVEMLTIIEIDTDERIRAQVLFSLDDLDSAFAELDVRYLAGEAAALAHTWSVVAKACAALSQRGLFPTTPDWVNVDHRRGIAFKSGDLTEYIRSAWNLLSGGGIYAKTAHRLSDLGAVYSWVGYGTSQDGSDVEFHGVNLLTVEGDLVNRVEIFDETDLDAALARFEELQPKARQLENAASRVDERFAAHFAARERQAMAGLMADAISIDDRRHVVNSGLRHGRDAEVANMRARVGVGVERITSAVVATRGERLALTRSCFSGRHPRPEEFHTEALCIVEIDAEERIVGRIGYDIADINAAFEELDARYLAGEGAAHSHTWSVVADLYAGFNRRELPATTPDWTYVDNRSVISIEASDLPAFISAGWELTPEISIHMEAVHRLSDLGVVVTHTAHGISPEDFNVEWRMIDIFTVDGDLISRCEMFDETDLDAALARFEELRP